MTTKVYVINDGPKEIKITRKAGDSYFVGTNELDWFYVYPDASVLIEEVQEPNES